MSANRDIRVPDSTPSGAAVRLPATHEAVLCCCVCDRPLLRYRPGGAARGIMMRCPHCRALQHRRV
jgi:hypothetical protein